MPEQLLESPKRISCESIYDRKRVFPIVWFGGIAFFLCTVFKVGIADKKPVIEFALFIAIPLLLAIYGYVFMRRILFTLMDEVWDVGGHLIVKFKDEEDRIAFTDISSVTYTTRPALVTLRLSKPSKFGADISFAPAFREMQKPVQEIAQDLSQRTEAARNCNVRS
jgi:hypothetical protein